jgi:hypothetical protein
MKKPVYKNKPIENIDALAKSLGVESSELLEISYSAQKYYHPNKPEEKPDGSIRQTYRVSQPLQDLQEKIKNNIFYEVDYPVYLQGGIKDDQNRRNYIRNASLHLGNNIVIKEDIANFFPSIRATLVFKMWNRLFYFPKDVSKVLLDLTTYKGFVPQGAKTSTYIANLVFWDKEPELESTMSSNGLTYSRLVDDITLSAKRKLKKIEVQHVTEAVYQMLFSLGFKPKRRKRRVMTSGYKISIHNLNTNSGSTTLSALERKRIRSAVKHCEISATLGQDQKVYEKIYSIVSGRVALLAKLHPHQAKKYIERLELIKPSKIH